MQHGNLCCISSEGSIMKKILFVLIGILSLAGCEKYTSSRLAIIIGDDEDMTVNFYDTILAGGYYSPAVMNLDLDNNGTDDIQFESWIHGSPAMGQIPESMIRCLRQDVAFSGRFTTDTVFVHKDVIILEEGKGAYKKYIHYNYTCNRISDADSIVSLTPSFRIVPLERDDTIEASDSFHTDTLTLAAHWYSYPPEYVENAGDTAIWEYRTYNNDCHDFPLEKIKYIGFKLDERLGLIKLSIFDWYKLVIHETVIQY